MAISGVLTRAAKAAGAKGHIGVVGGQAVHNVLSYMVFGEGGYLPATVIGETIATGTGAQFVFAAVAAQLPVERGSVTVVAGVVVATDDGQGGLAGAGVTGTIDYKTGAIVLTYTVAPALALPIVAGYSYRAVAKTPDALRTTTEAQESPEDPEDILHRAWYRKDFGADAFTTKIYVDTPSDREVCTLYLRMDEFIDDGRGEVPVIFEVGIFDTEDQMLAYATMDPPIFKDGSTVVSRTGTFIW